MTVTASKLYSDPGDGVPIAEALSVPASKLHSDPDDGVPVAEALAFEDPRDGDGAGPKARAAGGNHRDVESEAPVPDPKDPRIGGAMNWKPPDWAMERARAIVSADETILAVWTISYKNRRNEINKALAQWFCTFCPQIWVLMIVFSPCICHCSCKADEAMRDTLYVLTDRRLYQSVAEDRHSPCGCCSPEEVIEDFVDLKDINSDVRHVSRAPPVCSLLCWACPIRTCCASSYVLLRLPSSHPLATSSYDDSHEPPLEFDSQIMKMMVDNPEQAAKMILQAKAGRRSLGRTRRSPPAQTKMERQEIDPAKAILDLKKLLDAGAITRDEFDEKKAGLLAKMCGS